MKRSNDETFLENILMVVTVIALAYGGGFISYQLLMDKNQTLGMGMGNKKMSMGQGENNMIQGMQSMSGMVMNQGINQMNQGMQNMPSMPMMNSMTQEMEKINEGLKKYSKD